MLCCSEVSGNAPAGRRTWDNAPRLVSRNRHRDLVEALEQHPTQFAQGGEGVDGFPTTVEIHHAKRAGCQPVWATGQFSSNSRSTQARYTAFAATPRSALCCMAIRRRNFN